MKRRTPLSTLFLVLLLLFFTASLQAQITIHVDDDAPNDPGPGDSSISDPLEDGSAAHPFDAIQEGINGATTGSSVLVADGLYSGEGNRDLSFLGKKIDVRSVNGPENCTIDCQGSAAKPHDLALNGEP